MVSRAQVEAKRARQAVSLARNTHGFVPTPNVVAEELVGWPYHMLDDLSAGAVVVDPSGGDGALVRRILRELGDDDERLLSDPNAVTVVAVEPDDDRYAALQALASTDARVRPVHATLEEWAASSPDPVHAVAMNPPFSTPDAPRLWVDHILRCYQLLAPGGRLVSVTPDIDPPTTGAQRHLANLIRQHGGSVRYHLRRRVERCPGCDRTHLEDAAAVRTGFLTMFRLVWLVRPVPRPPGVPEWLLHPTLGSEPVHVGGQVRSGPDGPPVQRYREHGEVYHTVRQVGQCWRCRRLLWVHDDGREPAQDWACCSIIEACEDGLVGPSVGLCMACGSDGSESEQALSVARGYWSKPDGPPAGAPGAAVVEAACLPDPPPAAPPLAPLPAAAQGGQAVWVQETLL